MRGGHTQSSSRTGTFAGDGEMARRMRDFDWSATPVGSSAGWPQSLRIAVGILLNSRYPTFLWWGRELTNLYNDDTMPILGQRHPGALGQPAAHIWSETWDAIGPQTEVVLNQGRPARSEDLLLVLERNGYPEEAYFTFSYSPVRGDGGGVGGLFCTLAEDTQRVLGQRRLKTLHELAARTTAGAQSAEQACETASHALAGDRRDLPFTLIYLLDDGAQIARLAAASGLPGTSPAAPLRVDVAGSTGEGAGWPLRTVAESRHAEVVTELGRRFGALPGGAWPEPTDTAVVLPVVRSGQEGLAGFLVAGVSPRRRLDDDYGVFFDLVASQVATAIAHARAGEEERERAEALADLGRTKSAFSSGEKLRAARANALERFRLCFELGLIGMAITSPAKGCLEVNDQLCRILGYERDELLRMNWAELTHPDDLAADVAQFERVLAGKIDGYTMDKRWIHRDGRVIYSSIAVKCVRCEDGAVDYFVALLQDTTERKQAERALIESEAKFRTLAEASPALIWCLNSSGGSRYVNRPFLEFFGKTAEEVAGEGWHRLVHSDDAPKYIAEIMAAVREHQPLCCRARMRRHDRQWRWIEVRALPHFAEDGRYLEHVGHSLDITDSLEASASLRAGEERIKQLVALMPAAVYTCNEEGRITLFNRRAVELWGREPDRGDRFCGYWRLWRMDGSELPHDQGPMATCLREGTSVRDMVLTGEQPGGDRAVVSVSVAPLVNQRGRRVGAVNVFDDVTDRERAEEALRESEKNLAAELAAMARLQGVSTRMVQAGDSTSLLQEIVDAAIAITAADMGNIQFLDQDSGTLKIAASRGFERPFLEFFAAVHDGRAACGAALASAARVVIEDVTASPIFAGSPALTAMLDAGVRAVQSTPLVSRSGRVVGILSTHYRAARRPADRDLHMVDLLARQAADWIERTQGEAEREKLLQRERVARAESERVARVKDEFLATLSHELRTPLNAIVGWTHLVKLGVADPERVRRGMEVIERNARAQAQLIADLLDLSRIITGKMRLNVQRVELPVVIDAAIEAVRPAAEARGIRLQSVMEPIAQPVHGDAARLQQILWNLLSNAVKFTPEGGRVQVVLARVNSQVEISVSDTGQGIRPDFLPHVFERFRQADASAARELGGLGIGLALVKELAELHGGKVRATSGGEGQGATFAVKLPLAILHAKNGEPRQHPRVAAPVAPPLGEDSPPLDGVKVLVVDDEADALEVIGRILEDRFAEVVTVGSVEDALTALEREAFDVLLSDIGMPKRDGYDLISEVRRRGLTTPAAAVTAFARSEDRTRALLSGYQSHVTKPVEPSELLATVASLAGRVSP
jgi:PAS domain S-box-containing protein